MTRDWSSSQEKKLAVTAMMNATKENLSAKEEASVIVMTREVKENHSVVMTVSLSAENLTMRNQDVVFQEEMMTTKEVKKNLSVVEKENLSATRNLLANALIVTRNVHVAAAADTAERKILNSTVLALLAKSVSTNISPTQAYAHAVKPTTSSSLAL